MAEESETPTDGDQHPRKRTGRMDEPPDTFVLRTIHDHGQRITGLEGRMSQTERANADNHRQLMEFRDEFREGQSSTDEKLNQLLGGVTVLKRIVLSLSGVVTLVIGTIQLFDMLEGAIT